MGSFFHEGKKSRPFSKFININLIKAEMAKYGHSYTDMSELMGLTTPTYRSLITGAREPTIRKMIKVSQILKKPVSHFFNFEISE